MKIFIANWKMQLDPAKSSRVARELVKNLRSYKGKVVICPDFLSLASVSKILAKSPLLLGSQDVSAYEHGAYTGEVAASDLYSLGARYVLIGHSERRFYLQESNKLLAAKIKTAVANKLIPVLCVGENALDRKKGRALAVIRTQLKGALSSLPMPVLRSLIIAYEPVWAIGTGVNCEAEKALQMKTTISEWCQRSGLKRTTILYGGSANPENAASFLKTNGFDGLLIGTASLIPKSFQQIVQA